MVRLLAVLAFIFVLPGKGVATPLRAVVQGERLVLITAGGKALSGPALAGGEFGLPTGAGTLPVRIDRVEPSPERPSVLLLTMSVRKPGEARWSPLCDADVVGRRAGFPVAGDWDAGGRYRRTPGRWFLTCTSGAQGKCVLWGYDPWGRGPHGEDLAPFYEACIRMVRADYAGEGTAHTRAGMRIDKWDVAGVNRTTPRPSPGFAFEAGWGPDGAVCVARTRVQAELTLAALKARAPGLVVRCDEAEARRRGALLFNRSQ